MPRSYLFLHSTYELIFELTYRKENSKREKLFIHNYLPLHSIEIDSSEEKVEIFTADSPILPRMAINNNGIALDFICVFINVIFHLLKLFLHTISDFVARKMRRNEIVQCINLNKSTIEAIFMDLNGNAFRISRFDELPLLYL